ncbi:MAG: protein phosphatase 2C domain-containing protein [Burkholderiaceae bacterium]|nr:protein phosphatase 2C domain-containing protein [Burkholderiaceae bacterium]
MKFEIAYTQHSGKQHHEQQDAMFNGAKVIQSQDLPTTHFTLDVKSSMFAVADGVAVSPVPDAASRFVMQSLSKDFSKIISADIKAQIGPGLVRKVHGKLCDRYAKGKTKGSSATLAMVQCTGDMIVALNVGDSRVYRINCHDEWQQLSMDHTVGRDMIDEGELTELGVEGAEFDDEVAMYSGLAHCLIADHEEDGFPVHHVTASLNQEDRLLLCTDGVHDVLGDARLQCLYDAKKQVDEQVNIWREAILDIGAPDNFSLILVERIS